MRGDTRIATATLTSTVRGGEVDPEAPRIRTSILTYDRDAFSITNIVFSVELYLTRLPG